MKIRQILTALCVAALLSSGAWLKPLSAHAQDIDNAAFEKAMEAFLQKDANVEKVGDALQRYFMKKRQEQMEKMQKDRAAQAQDQAKQMEEQFNNPVKVDIGSSPVKGAKDAKITIFEFSEFSCPFCKRVGPTLDQVMKEYPDQVRIVFKHTPLPMHPDAKPAAMASWAAQQQGKFWEYHDELFADQQARGEENYVKMAEKLGLDIAKFKADMKSNAAAKAVEADAAQSKEKGVFGTPGFFINGVKISGAQPFPEFQKVIDKWLEKMGS